LISCRLQSEFCRPCAATPRCCSRRSRPGS
jgi:hypothetical protein